MDFWLADAPLTYVFQMLSVLGRSIITEKSRNTHWLFALIWLTRHRFLLTMDIFGGNSGEKNASIWDSLGFGASTNCRNQRRWNPLPRTGTVSHPARALKESRFHKDKWVADIGQRRKQPWRYNWPVTASSLINRIRSFHSLYSPNLPGSQEPAGC